MTRIAIIGHPRAGKTYFANSIYDSINCASLLRADVFAEKLNWSEQSDAIIKWIEEHPDHIVEGVKVYYALRKGYVPDLIWLVQAAEPVKKPGRVTLSKQLDSIFAKWRQEHPLIRVDVVPGRPSWVDEDQPDKCGGYCEPWKR